MPPTNNIRLAVTLRKPTALAKPAAYVVARSAVNALAGAQVQLYAQVVNRLGSPLELAGRSVHFAFVAGSGGALSVTTATTNSQGVAQTTLTVGSVGGTVYRLKATDTEGYTGTSANITVVVDTTPASIALSPSPVALAEDGTAQLTAAIKNDAGATLALSPSSYSSSDTDVATVNGSGLVTWVGGGTATILAHYSALTSNGITVTADAAGGGGGGSDSYPNEPAGFTPLSPLLTGDVLPPTADELIPGSANDIGWTQGTIVRKVVDAEVPVDSSSVLEIDFPPGSLGGGAPGKVWTNIAYWPQRPRSLYQSFWYKLSPNFPANLVSNKVIYTGLLNLGNTVYIELNASKDDGTAYTAPIWPGINVQGIRSVNGDTNTSQNFKQGYKQLIRGQWHHFESLFVANTAGTEDGLVWLLMDGFSLVYVDKIKWTEAANPWGWTTWWPVYGGGGQVPFDAVNPYHRLKDFYVSGKAA